MGRPLSQPYNAGDDRRHKRQMKAFLAQLKKCHVKEGGC